MTKPRNILIFFVLISFLVITLFSIAPMLLGSVHQMSDGCPLMNAPGQILCPSNNINSALHHIAVFNNLLNIIVSFGSTNVLLLILLLVIATLLLIGKSPPINSWSIRYRNSDFASFLKTIDFKIRHWLSLLENSPTFA